MKMILLIAAVFFMTQSLRAQTLYVDGLKGSDAAAGTPSTPLASLQKAVALAKDFSGNEPITIKLAPGLYMLTGPLKLETRSGGNDAANYTLEAMVMPDDTAWNPYKMPVITSVAENNDNRHFPHCAGIFVARANVAVCGLKFTGNSNPNVMYYYPIVRDSLTLNNLELSQCYFIGEKNSSPVQGAIYVEGPGIHVDHCIFYGCKNAVLAFEKMKDFSVKHSIIYGAYECAFWYSWHDEQDQPFTFSDNIISHCNYFWYEVSVLPQGPVPCHFDHCLVCQNDGYSETDGKNAPVIITLPFRENDVRKTGSVSLVEVKTDLIPHDYLNLAPGSDGMDLGAGIFKKVPQK